MGRRVSCSGGEELAVRLAGRWSPSRGEDDLHSAEGEWCGGAVQQQGCGCHKGLKKRCIFNLCTMIGVTVVNLFIFFI